MLNHDIAYVPEDEWHRPSGLRHGLFGVIPRVAAAVDPSRAIAIDTYPLPAEDKPGSVVLEGDRVGVVAPVIEVV